MLKTLVLICAASVQPQDCTRETAIDVVQSVKTGNPTMCAFFGQSGIAPTSVAPKMGETYEKVVCERVREDAAR